MSVDPARDLVVRDAKTLGDLRAFLEQAETLGFDNSDPVHVRWGEVTVSSWLGAPK